MDKKSNILVIAPQPFFSFRGTPFSVYYRTFMTAGMGYKIDFLTYGEGKNVNIPNTRFFRTPRFKFLGDVKIGPSFLKLFLDVFIFLRMLGLLIRNKYNIVHAHEEAVFFATFLKPFFRYRLIYDMHSSLTQQITNFNFSKSKFLINVFGALEKWSLARADAVITICPDLHIFASTIIPDKSKLFLIENTLFEEVQLRNRNGSVDSFQKYFYENFQKRAAGKKIILYAGTLEKYQGIDLLIDSFKHVVKEYPDILLFILGGAKDQVTAFNQMVKDKGLENNIILTGLLAQSYVKQFTKMASILVSPRISGTNTPLKIYEQIASGIPLVATRIYSHTQILNDDVAFLVEPEPEDMAKGILAALCDKDKAEQKATEAQKLYEQNYSKQNYLTKLKKVLELVS